MAPKKKAPRQKKAALESVSPAPPLEPVTPPLKVESRGDGVVVVESGVKKIEQMAALDIAQLNSLNLPLPPPVIKPGERGLGLGSELTRPLHGSALLEELSKMRQEKFLTDLELACKTKAFDVHKLVISSISQYFREILAKDPNMRDWSCRLCLANVITFAYLGRVHMSLYTIGCTVSAAATLQIPQLLKMCMDFLLAELNVQTCVYIWNIAAAYGLRPVCDAARKFVLENFVQFSDTPLFTQLTLEQITAFIQDDNLMLPSEVTAFQLVMKWLDFDSSRQTHAAELLSHVRFETIPASELVSQIQPVPRMMLDPQCHRLLVDAMNYHLLPYQQNTLQSRRTQARGSQPTLLTVGGGPLSPSAPSAGRYDPRFNTWLHLASMRQRRTHFSLAASGGRLFAIGGRNVEGLLATTESYLPSTNTWQMRSPMEVPRCCHSSSTLPSGDILVTGGYINCAYSRSVACYKVETDTWVERAPMETPRGWHCSATLGGKVYVVGGSQLGPGGERVDVLSVEVYSPETGAWTRAAPLPLGVSTAGLSPLSEKLYLLGGWNEAEKRYKAAVQRYDPGTDSWSRSEDLPEATVACPAAP
ncbi:hypothetical protein WMY93_019358 [Mugilogobius chulae]|uniref:BTB domain-containing protein n=1 Tax=Mugilogobius chulae TaxID=88201 RepID=A0AAW0NIX6_9GOBI